MKRGGVLLAFLVLLFVIGGAYATSVYNDLHLSIQVTHSNGSIDTGTFAFVFNISNSSSCADANVVYSNSTTLATDSRGIISYYLEDVILSPNVQHWLCYYRDGTLVDTSRFARVPYAFHAKNITLSGVNSDTNFNLKTFNITNSNYGFFSYLGDVLSRVSKLFIQDINSTGNFTTTGRIGIGTSNPRNALSVVGDINTTGVFYGNGSRLTGIVASGGDTGTLDGYNSLFFMPLNRTVTGNFTFDSGTLFIDSSNNRIGIGTTRPNSLLHLKSGTLTSTTIGAKDTRLILQLDTSTSGAGGEIVFAFNGTDVGTERAGAIGFGALSNTVSGGTGRIYIATKSLSTDTTLTERLTVLPNGYVGINTTTPTHLFSISGALGEIYTNNGARQLILTGQPSGEVFTGAVLNVNPANQGAANRKLFGLGVNNAERFSVDVEGDTYIAGDVGINTTTPQNLLNVRGDANITGFIYGDGSQLTNLPSSEGGLSGVGTYGYIPMWNGTSSLNNSNIFQLGSNVGIGTTDPEEKLHMVGSDTVGLFERTTTSAVARGTTVKSRLTTTADMEDGFGGGYLFAIQDNAGVSNNIAAIYAIRAGADDSGDMRFDTYNAGVVAERMRITKDGKVGIGTTNPGHLLNVKGTSNLSSTNVEMRVETSTVRILI